MTVQTVPASTVSELRLEPAAEAVVFRGPDHGLERIAVATVVLAAGEALVEVELATVCGSDLHTVEGRRRVAVPQVLGHEQVGRIVALGPGEPVRTVDGLPLSVGDRVVWSVVVDCGECRNCRHCMPQKCEQLRKYGHEQMRRGWQLSGGIATHVHLVARTAIVRVPEALPAEVLAPASCATATVAAAIEAAAVRPLHEEVVLVSGCGMLGLTAVAFAKELGAIVVAVDPDPSRRDLALRFGADAVSDAAVDAIRSGIAAAAREARVPVEATPGFTAALELSGSNAAIGILLETADIGATIVLAGSVFTAPAIPLSAESVVRRLLTIRGVHNYRPDHLVKAAAFLARADPQAFGALVGEILPWDEATEALSRPATTGTRIGIRP